MRCGKLRSTQVTPIDLLVKPVKRFQSSYLGCVSRLLVFWNTRAHSLYCRFIQSTRLAEVTDRGMKFQIERLSGSDPTFEKVHVVLDRPAKSNALAFWMIGARTVCRALPFFRLGLPQQPQETSFYVFNRVENGGFRWISYQEAREQEFVAGDDELLSLIALGKPRP